MLKPYELLENVLIDIEKNIRDGVCLYILAEKFSVSQGHLRRLFKFAFRQSLSGYIRSRKLAASIDDLLKTNSKILNIALDYGFDYEQSYNRTFKREFGITPGELRKSGKILKITPPLQLFDSNRFRDGLVFGPDIVMVPQFHVVGKNYEIPVNRDQTDMNMSIIKQFFFNDQHHISNVVNHNEFINICRWSNVPGFWRFMPALQVKSLKDILEGFEGYTFPTSLCANFHFIYTDYHFDKYNFNRADRKFDELYKNIDEIGVYPDKMFKAVDEFMDNKEQKYFLDRRVCINKFSFSEKNGNALQLEWFAPVSPDL